MWDLIRSLRRGLLASVIIAGAGCRTTGGSDMEFTEIKYVVSDLVEAPQVLTIESTGQASYRSHTNEQMLDRPEIGLYATQLDSSLMASIGQLLSQRPLSEVPDHTGRLPEGASGKSLIIKTRFAEVTKQVGPADPVDPKMQELLDFFDGVVREVMESPRQVLRISSGVPSIDDSGRISVTLELANPGDEPAFIRKPSDMVGQLDGWLKLEIWPATPEPGSLWAEQKVYVDVERTDPESEGDNKTIVLTLAPGQTRAVTLKGHFSGRPARHVARVSYCNFTEWSKDTFLITGHVYSQPVEFDIP